MKIGSGQGSISTKELLAEGGWSRISCSMLGASFRVVIERELTSGRRLHHLSKREYSVAQLFARGLSSKEVGTELSMAAATVRGVAERIRHKLGLQATAQLPLFLHSLGFPCAPPRREGHIEVLCFECDLEGISPEGLSRAERALALQVLWGHHNEQIARQRNLSASTIANQLHSVFRKLRVSSRGELVVALLSAAHGGQVESVLHSE